MNCCEEKHSDKEVIIMQVIKTTLLRRGSGTAGDPIRRVEQYWTLDGELLVEKDLYDKTNN